MARTRVPESIVIQSLDSLNAKVQSVYDKLSNQSVKIAKIEQRLNDLNCKSHAESIRNIETDVTNTKITIAKNVGLGATIGASVTFIIVFLAKIFRLI